MQQFTLCTVLHVLLCKTALLRCNFWSLVSTNLLKSAPTNDGTLQCFKSTMVNAALIHDQILMRVLL